MQSTLNVHMCMLIFCSSHAKLDDIFPSTLAYQKFWCMPQLTAQRDQLLIDEREEQKFIAKQLHRLEQYEESSKALHRSLQEKDHQYQMLRSLHGDECERNAALTQQLRRVDANNVALAKRWAGILCCFVTWY